MTSLALPLPSSFRSELERVTLFDLPVCKANLAETVRWIKTEVLAKPGPCVTAFTVNTDHLIRRQKDAEFDCAYAASDLVFADGMPLVWCSKILGKALPGRVTGVDLFHALCKGIENEPATCFLLGARQHVLNRAVKNLKRQHPALKIRGVHHGYFSDDTKVIDLINARSPDILFVGLGSPRQEVWLAKNAHRLCCKLALVIGGTLDIVAGDATRAPRMLQNMGLEWSWRLASEPRRLWRRYLIECPQIVPMLFREAIGLMPRHAAPLHPAPTQRRP